MIYLSNFELPNEQIENEKIMNKMNIHNDVYPFNLFTPKRFDYITFDPITIFYGGNGSGKTTLLNIISNKIKANRRNIDKKNELFKEYLDICRYEFENEEDLKSIKYITSDDVFDYLLDLRAINSNVNRRKEELVKEYMSNKYGDTKEYNSALDEYEDLKNQVDARKMTASQYVRTRLSKNTIVQESNGETALDFWQNEIQDDSLYIIDEPENSLSAENQLKLKQFIEESARFFNCQFIIATHSPFLLSLKGAKVYDLDSVPVESKKWTQLENVKVYYDFFNEHSSEFEE
jgi:predicted ATPase